MQKLTALVPALAATLAMAACASPNVAGPAAPSTAPAATSSPSATQKEVSALHPRAVLAHAEGLTTVDLSTGEAVGHTAHEGFLRLNDAGDGRHVMVTDGDAFRVYDAGLIAEGHDDHFHYFASEPKLTDVSYDAPKAGHVVVHGDKTVLFGDGDGSIQIVKTKAIADPDAAVRKLATDDPHHGVALELADGTLFTTQGTADARSVLQVKRGDTVAAETDDCPGSHGEAVAEPTAKGDVVVVGCTDGPVVYRDGAFYKVPVEDAYSRSGNLAGSEHSPIVLGDYKVDKDAELERPTRVALIDTRAASLRTLDLGSSYWFRSLARGPHGEGLVLTYDGALQVIDVAAGDVTATIPAIQTWEEKPEWQQPGPILKVAGERAYITDAEKRELVVVDLESHEVVGRHALEVAPVEMAIATGLPPHAGHDH